MSEHIGFQSFQPYAVNTFNGRGKNFLTLTPMHYVNPHSVSPHYRGGSFISGYWRDGDGNTSIDRSTGYYARNPNAIPKIIKARGNIEW